MAFSLPNFSFPSRGAELTMSFVNFLAICGWLFSVPFSIPDQQCLGGVGWREKVTPIWVLSMGCAAVSCNLCLHWGRGQTWTSFPCSVCRLLTCSSFPPPWSSVLQCGLKTMDLVRLQGQTLAVSFLSHATSPYYAGFWASIFLFWGPILELLWGWNK